MVSWGEIFVTLTAAGYLLGRKELPKLAHFAGTYTGRSIGAILRAKKEFFDATKDNELIKLQREFQKGIEEINQIRSEFINVGSMQRPLQPTSTAPSPRTPSTATTADAFSTPTAASSTLGGVDRSSLPSSISMASTNFSALAENDHENRTEHAKLAIIELKLAKEGKYASRIESIEGGADYVSASIVDSLLLDPIENEKKK